MHNHSHANDESHLFWAALITGIFMLVEVIGGWISGSLAIVADAAHMLTDFVSLGFAWFALRLAHKPADLQRTYGFARFQILIAFANGISLFFILAWIIYEAVSRLASPIPVIGETMLLIAFFGLIANFVVFRILHLANQENLNIRGAVLHVVADMLGSGAALAAGALILLTGWLPADPLFSLFVAGLILFSGWGLIKRAGHILLEGAPPAFDVVKLASDLQKNVPGLVDVHHVHAWLLTQEQPMLTLHARITESQRSDTIILGIKKRLAQNYGITHTTIQVELETCRDEPNTLTG